MFNFLKDKDDMMATSSNFNEIYVAEIEAGKKIADRYADAYETLFYETTRKMISEMVTHNDAEILNVLDIGCGTGNLTKFFSEKQNCNVVAIDISTEMLRVAKKKLEGVHFLSSTAGDTPFKKNSFDAVVGYSALHHLPDLEGFFLEIFRILKPGGLFVFGEPVESFLSENKTLYRFFKLPLYPLYLFFKMKNSKNLKVFQDINFDAFATSVHRHLTEKEVVDSIAKTNSKKVSVRIKRLGILSPWFGGVLFKSRRIDCLVFKPLWYLDLILAWIFLKCTSEMFITGKIEQG